MKTPSSSNDLRLAIEALEQDLATANSDLLTCQTQHRITVRKSVWASDHAASGDSLIVAETALAAAHTTHSRIVATLHVARAMLAEVTQSEREAERSAARATIEAELEDMAETARRLDTSFAELVGQLMRLHARETDLHRVALQHFRSPWVAPQVRTAARGLATFLGTLANGTTPDARPFIAESVASGTHSIVSTFHD